MEPLTHTVSTTPILPYRQPLHARLRLYAGAQAAHKKRIQLIFMAKHARTRASEIYTSTQAKTKQVSLHGKEHTLGHMPRERMYSTAAVLNLVCPALKSVPSM